jgi:hypothetical protein
MKTMGVWYSEVHNAKPGGLDGISQSFSFFLQGDLTLVFSEENRLSFSCLLHEKAGLFGANGEQLNSVFHKVQKFIEKLSDFQLLKEDFSPLNY